MTALSNKPAFPAMYQDRFIEGGITLREHAVIEMAKALVIACASENSATVLSAMAKQNNIVPSEQLALLAAQQADAVLRELESKPQWTKFADKMPPAKTPIWISNPRNAVPGFQFQHTRFNASAKDWISAGWTHWMPATNVPTKPKEGE